MNEKNLDYLSNQLKFSGFGEGHNKELKEKLQKQAPEFTIFHNQDFGKDRTVASLTFKKSAETDMYFFNRYTLVVKPDQAPEASKQTFYMSNKDDNITLKEGYNLMTGRAVHKELSNKEGEKYNAWVQLDFKAIDKNGNHEMKKFHQNYGFDLEQALTKLPIKELSNEVDKGRLISSLERGNRQAVTLADSGKEQKVFIEAAPQFKSINLYDSSHQRIHLKPLPEKQKEVKDMNESEKPGTHKKQDKKAGEDGGEPPMQPQSKSRKKTQKIS